MPAHLPPLERPAPRARRVSVRRILLALAVVAAAAGEAHAIKLSAAIPSGYAIQRFELTPDGTTVVYALEEEGLGNAVRLVAVPVAGGSATTLVDIPLSGSQRSIDDWTITPNGTGVVFLSDKDAQQFRNDLFRVPVDGSAAALKLNVAPAPNDLDTFAVSPSSARVVFEAANDKIFSVPTTGGTPVELGTGTGSFLPRYRISPDGTRVVFPFDDGMGGGRQLYSVPTDGSQAPIKLTSQTAISVPGENGGAAVRAAITPDSTKALFLSRPDPAKPAEYELWVTPIAQAAPTKLAGPLAIYFPDLRLTPDGTVAVFTAGTFPGFRIYRVPVDGSASEQPVSAVGQNVIVSEYQMSPNGQTFVYRVFTSGKYHLFSVGLAGGDDVELTSASPAGFGPYNGYLIDPTGTRVVYAAQQDAANVDELYGAPIGGGGSLKLSKSPAPVTGGDVLPSSVTISPDGLTVLYVADQDTDTVNELFSVGIASGGPQKVHANLAPDRDVASDPAFTPDSATIVYLSDQDTSGVFELFTTDDPPPGPTPTSTPGGGPTPTATIAGTVTPTPVATRTPAPETGDRCSDCIDNDFDGDVDRADGDCPPYAGGAGAGSTAGKSVAKCGKALGKAGTDFALKRVKALSSCLQKAFACVQTGGDAACLAKAGAACAKAEAARQAAITKARTAVAKACGDPPVAAADLTGLGGIGYGTEVAACAPFGGGSLASASDVTTCLVARHACLAETLIGLEIPRARDLLAASGHDATLEAPCLPAGAGAGSGPDSKAALTCQKALAKAGAGYGSARLKAAQKCADGAFQCVQLKQNDAACRAKAAAKCAQLAAKVGTAAGKVTAALAKGCPSFADLTAASAVGFDARSAECGALETPADTVAGAAACLVAQHACRVDQLMIGQSPRGDELGARGF